MNVLGILSSLWAVPFGVVLHRNPLWAFPAAVGLTQAFTVPWALLDLAVLTAAAATRWSVR